MNRREALQKVFQGALTCTYVAAFGIPKTVAAPLVQPTQWTWGEVRVGFDVEREPGNERQLAVLERRIRETEADQMRQLFEKTFGVI